MKRLKWYNEPKIEERYKNFNGSTLTMAVKYDKPTAYIDEIDKRKRGVLIDITRIIAERGKFELNISFYNNKGDKKSLEEYANFEFYFIAQLSAYMNEAHCTSTFSETKMVFEMTPPEKFTNWEKVLLPFDEEIWRFLIITFSVAFLSVLMINRASKSIKDLIYGEGIKVPAYNILGTFFGIGQLKLPEGNFARILLMIFILFCLIVRTAYQGVLFEMMANDIRKKPPEKISDLAERNYTIISINERWSWNLLTQMIPANQRPLNLHVTHEEYYSIFKHQIKNESAKLAMLTDNNPKISGVQLKEALLSDTTGFAMLKNQFLYWLTEETLQLLIPSGIPIYLEKFYNDICYPRKKDSGSGPSVLNIDDLHYGFVIWIVAILTTLIAFIGEFFVKCFLVKLVNGIIKSVRKFVGLIFVIDWLIKREIHN